MCRTLCPRARAVTKKETRLEDLVREAVKRELDGEPVRQRRSRRSQGSAASSSASPPPPEVPPLTLVPPAPQSPPVRPAVSSRSQGRQTDPILMPAPVTQPVSAAVQPPSGLHRNCIPTSTVMTTMQRCGVVHLFDDCGSLGTPKYRQTRVFCQHCLARHKRDATGA